MLNFIRAILAVIIYFLRVFKIYLLVKFDTSKTIEDETKTGQTEKIES